MTLIQPSALYRLRYTVRHGDRPTIIRSAVGEEHGFTIRVRRFEAPGFEVSDLVVHAFELPDEDIDGLLGWDFLSRFRVELRPDEQRILSTPLKA